MTHSGRREGKRTLSSALHNCKELLTYPIFLKRLHREWSLLNPYYSQIWPLLITYPKNVGNISSVVSQMLSTKNKLAAALNFTWIVESASEFWRLRYLHSTPFERRPRRALKKSILADLSGCQGNWRLLRRAVFSKLGPVNSGGHCTVFPNVAKMNTLTWGGEKIRLYQDDNEIPLIECQG